METEVFTAAAKRNNREKARGSKYRKSRKSEQTALETVTLLELELEKRRRDEETNNASGTLKLKKRSKRRVY